MSAHWIIYDYDLDTFTCRGDRIATDEDTDEMYCSECGKMALLNRYEEYVPSKFCPHCGKEMYVPIKCEELLKSLNIGVKMENPKCPYCGGEMKPNTGTGHNIHGNKTVWFTYCCDVCEAESPPCDSRAEARAAAMRRTG